MNARAVNRATTLAMALLGGCAADTANAPPCEPFYDGQSIELREQSGGDCGPFTLTSLFPPPKIGLSCPQDTGWVSDNGGCSRARVCFYNLGRGLVARMDAMAHVDTKADAGMSATAEFALHYSDGSGCLSAYDTALPAD